jgi:hypothetical protein
VLQHYQTPTTPRQQLGLIRHIILACVVARFTIQDCEVGAHMLDMMIISHRFHRICEINTVDIKCLERVDGVDILDCKRFFMRLDDRGQMFLFPL